MSLSGNIAIKVDHGIPVPPRKRTGPPGYSYPWTSMAVGDSFVFPWCDNLRKTRQRATTAVSRRKHWSQSEHRVETVTEDGAQVVRVWRVR